MASGSSPSDAMTPNTAQHTLTFGAARLTAAIPDLVVPGPGEGSTPRIPEDQTCFSWLGDEDSNLD
jgi:hypothetical protein